MPLWIRMLVHLLQSCFALVLFTDTDLLLLLVFLSVNWRISIGFCSWQSFSFFAGMNSSPFLHFSYSADILTLTKLCKCLLPSYAKHQRPAGAMLLTICAILFMHGLSCQVTFTAFDLITESDRKIREKLILCHLVLFVHKKQRTKKKGWVRLNTFS